MIKYNTLGFLQQYQNPLIDCIQYLRNGYCDIYFTDGRKTRHFVNCETVYNHQFGIPLSCDGTLLYVSSWEKGLTAYSTDTGEKVWHFRSTRIGSVFPYENFLLVHRYNQTLYRLDPYTGELLQEKKSGTLEFVHLIDKNYLFADRFRGKYVLIDATTMEIAKTYPNKIVNPDNCLSFVIREAHLKDRKLYIEGFQEYPKHSWPESQYTTFYRMIDEDFWGNDTDSSSS